MEPKCASRLPVPTGNNPPSNTTPLLLVTDQTIKLACMFTSADKSAAVTSALGETVDVLVDDARVVLPDDVRGTCAVVVKTAGLVRFSLLMC